ncbi:exo-beta-N-acetylmuramidase NamZ domain-containing protein [Flavobacterium chuncheonense]|uniref:Exo-beta-N-acetylmuramidase NamZ domain-containing protein n=1 Tax=Flavobacterium chuncheonense TaxID=2026653 RepID=A0ABW5YMP7_9FLAO
MIQKLVFKNTLLFSFILIFSCGNSATTKVGPEKLSIENNTSESTILTGADNLKENLNLLKNKKIGIVTNQTGILSNGTHLVDYLLSEKIKIKTIFAPEHGFRGTADAGELIKDGKDTQTGLPIISLYGNNKKPKPEQLKGIEILIFDLQDVGARFYTYISSLHYVMEACAENNIPLLVLDRPNPNGNIVDGPILESEFHSFVGMHEIPVLHGMTIGEYAKMINGEKWLSNGVQCNLSVISCKNYNRKMSYSLPVKPSPNLPNDQSINLYASLCFFEGTNVSVGRGTDKQFQIYGSPFLPKSNFSFTPKPNLGAKDPIYNGKLCYGEDLTKAKKVSRLELQWLIKAYNETADKTKFFNSFFTKLAGTKKLQQQIESGFSEVEIRASWQEDLENFKVIREKYLIY